MSCCFQNDPFFIISFIAPPELLAGSVLVSVHVGGTLAGDSTVLTGQLGQPRGLDESVSCLSHCLFKARLDESCMGIQHLPTH